MAVLKEASVSFSDPSREHPVLPPRKESASTPSFLLLFADESLLDP